MSFHHSPTIFCWNREGFFLHWILGVEKYNGIFAYEILLFVYIFPFSVVPKIKLKMEMFPQGAGVDGVNKFSKNS